MTPVLVDPDVDALGDEGDVIPPLIPVVVPGEGVETDDGMDVPPGVDPPVALGALTGPTLCAEAIAGNASVAAATRLEMSSRDVMGAPSSI